MDQYNWDGFTVSMTMDEDGDWCAYFVELPNVSAFADNTQDALTELATAWEAMKESYHKRGEPIPVAPANKNYSGQFNVRIGRQLHRNLAMEAASVGVSLNALVSQKLAHSSEFRV